MTYRVETFDRKSRLSWNAIRDRVAEIEVACFGVNAYTDDQLRVEFNKRLHTNVLLWDDYAGEEFLLGYTCASPVGLFMGVRLKSATYYIGNTAIAPVFQGQGLVRLLLEKLYANLRDLGVLYIERDAAIASGYADNLVRVHAEDIIETKDHDSKYGPQRFIKMRVPRA